MRICVLLVVRHPDHPGQRPVHRCRDVADPWEDDQVVLATASGVMSSAAERVTPMQLCATRLQLRWRPSTFNTEEGGEIG